MPHCRVEYSANLASADIPGLLRTIAAKYASEPDVFPVVGIRVRAIAALDYVIADGADDYGFVHLTCMITPGRSEEYKRRFFGEMFDLAKAHFATRLERQGLGISLDVEESAVVSFKFQNIVRRPA